MSCFEQVIEACVSTAQAPRGIAGRITFALGCQLDQFCQPEHRHQNGIDWHVFPQLTAGRGAAAFLGENLTQIAGIGLQLGFLFPAGSTQVNLKANAEFAAENRAAGFNAG